jgi:uncharacterized YkwD family protein
MIDRNEFAPALLEIISFILLVLVMLVIFLGKKGNLKWIHEKGGYTMKRLVMLLGLVLLLAACSKQTASTKGQMQVSSVDTNLPVNQHIVQKNESIGDIAEKYHVNIDDFLRQNPDIAKQINIDPTPSKDVKVPQDVLDTPIQPDQKVTIPANESLTGYEEEVLKLTNQERQKAGLSACAGNDSSLNRSAKAKSEDMAAHNYFSHESPTYGDPFAMMRNFGVQYKSAGENIAKGQPTPQEVVTGWMNSPEHRANIMNGSYTHLGVGYVVKNGEPYWTQQFIGK